MHTERSALRQNGRRWAGQHRRPRNERPTGVALPLGVLGVTAVTVAAVAWSVAVPPDTDIPPVPAVLPEASAAAVPDSTPETTRGPPVASTAGPTRTPDAPATAVQPPADATTPPSGAMPYREAIARESQRCEAPTPMPSESPSMPPSASSSTDPNEGVSP